MKNIFSTKFFRVVIVVAIFAALIMINPYRIFNPLRGMLAVVFSPFNKVSYIFSRKADDMREFFFSIGQLKKENSELLIQNQQLLAENAGLLDQKNENEFLRQQLQLLPRDRFVLESAFVIGHDVTGLGNWLDIDKGSNAGIKEGMAVIVSKGIIVGKVQQVFPTSAKIMLLSHPASALNVQTNDSEAKGIVKGEYGLGIIMDMILQTDTVNDGSEVVTSGIGGNIPRGLYVGVARQVHPSDDHLFQQAVISSPIEPSKLDTVFVIKGDK